MGSQRCAVLTLVLSASVGERERVRGVDLRGVAVAEGHLLGVVLLPGAVGHGDLTELSGEVWRALAPVPRAALAPVHTGQVAHHWRGGRNAQTSLNLGRADARLTSGSHKFRTLAVSADRLLEAARGSRESQRGPPYIL